MKKITAYTWAFILVLVAFFTVGMFTLGSTKTTGKSMTVLKDETVTISNKNGYFSLFPLEKATVTLSGCKYPLNNYTLKSDNPSYAVSNEVIGKSATITVNGKAILCESIK